MKNIALSKTAKIAINSKIKLYGEVLDIEIDTKQNKLELEVLLKGEIESLKISIGQYTLQDNKIIISQISTSREWLNTLSKEYLENKSFNIPQEYMSILEKIV